MAAGRLSHRISTAPANNLTWRRPQQTVDNRGARKHSQCHFTKRALAQHGPGTHIWTRQMSLGAYPPLPPNPSLSLWLSVHLFESVQFARCVCEVRVIQTLQQVYCFDKRHHFTEKRKKKNHKLLWGVVWSLKKRDIQSKCLSHCKQQYHREAFRTTTKKNMNIPAKIRERKEHYVFTISPAFSVYLADDELYCCWACQASLGLQIPLVGHSGGVWPICYLGTCIYSYVHVYSMCTGILYVLYMCMIVC